LVAPLVPAAVAVLALLAGPRAAPTAAAPASVGPTLDRKALEVLALAWAKARPRTKFDAWDPQVRADLLAKAKAMGPIPEGSLEEVRDVFWRALKKQPSPVVESKKGPS